MVLFSILVTIAVILAAIAIGALIVLGTAGFVIFGDLITCIAVIAFICWLIRRKR